MRNRPRFSRTQRQFIALTSAFFLGSLVIAVMPDSRSNGPTYVTAAETTVTSQVAAVEFDIQSGGDWPQFGGNSYRNNTPNGTGITTEWAPGRFDRRTGEWIKDRAENIKWVAQLGSNAYGNPVVAGGTVLIGTNNGAGYLERYPSDVDLGCLLCFRETDGEFLWQYSIEALEKQYYYPGQGLCSTPLVEGDRVWVVTNAGTIVCLDRQGFRDNENDGPFQDEPSNDAKEADVIWVFDMMKELGSSQHDMCACAITAYGDLLFASTSNGIDEAHEELAAPDAPSFVCLDKNTGKVYWTDNSPGANILHGQWGSPAAGVINGVPQVVFTGGDGWVYSFKCNTGQNGKPELLWKFDANPKDTEWLDHGRGTRNNILACPVIHENHVYVTVGQDPDHGADQGHLWCIAPTKSGDISEQLVVKKADNSQIAPVRRVTAIDPDQGEVAIANPNSCVAWHYVGVDINGDDEVAFEETMHRSVGTVAVKNNLLFVADVGGVVHCLDATTGKPHWTYDMLANSWGSPLIVDDKVFFADEDGDVAIFKLSAEPQEEPINEINMGGTAYGTPIVANNVLYISTKSRLFAISSE